MRSMLLALALMVAMIGPVYADVSVGTAAFLKEIGINPASADVISISNDVVSNKDVKDVSLNSLAAKRDEEGVKRFIATRAFIHKYEADSSTPFPPEKVYNTTYLTRPEQDFVFCHAIAKGFGLQC